MAFIGIGSNHDAERQALRAVRLLARRTTIHAISTFYRSPPADAVAAPWFCNGVVVLSTRMPVPWLINAVLKPIERRLGRNRIAPHITRVAIDLDLLLTTQTKGSDLRPSRPHPTIRDRPYVAIPLFEVAGDLPLDEWDTTLGEIVGHLPESDMTPLIRLTNRIRQHHLEPEART